jgi:hypothetical protein
VQLPFELKLTLDEYLSQEAWLSATLPSCPIDGDGCLPVGHGCYWRKYPQPVPIARFYCASSHTTFSLLPDFLSSRYRGALAEFEEVCVAAENGDCLAVANAVRSLDGADNITARAAARWVGRRVILFQITLRALMGQLGQLVEGVRTATQLRERLGCPAALVALRAAVAQNLGSLPPPLGFGPWPSAEQRTQKPRQHTMEPGLEPPSG